MLKILIADDHELFLDGLKFAISDLDDDTDIVTAGDYTELLAKFKKEPDAFNLLLTDLAMPGMPWDMALKQIHGLNPEIPIVIISAVYDNDTVSKAVDLGVSGFIPKTSSNRVIINAINLVLGGGVYIPKDILEKKKKDAGNANEECSIMTSKQLTVLKLIAQGKSNKVIAAELDISEGTVKIHVTAILKALGANNRTGAVIEAARRGIIEENPKQ